MLKTWVVLWLGTDGSGEVEGISKRVAYRTIVVGFNESGGSKDALALAKLLAETTGARLVIAGVVRHRAAELFTIRTAAKRALEQSELAVAKTLQHAGESIGAEAEAVRTSCPARGLAHVGRELEADAIVVGSSARAKRGRVLAGKTTLRLLRRSPCPVIIAPIGFAHGEPRLAVIGAGVDGSLEADEALEAAVALGTCSRGTLRLVSVADVGDESRAGSAYDYTRRAERMYARFHACLDKAVVGVPAALRPAADVVRGQAAPVLALEAEKGLDLLCVGSCTHGSGRRSPLGSVCAELVRNLACPILVAPRRVTPRL